MANIFHSTADRHGARFNVAVRSRRTAQLAVSMVLMESYMFCASVRLGVLAISTVALAKSLIIIYVLSTEGIGFMLSIISTFDINVSYRASYYMVRDAILWLEKYPQIVSILLQLYSIGHVMSCVIAAYGAYKLKRFFVLPLAIFEFLYIVEVAGLLILFLRIVRHFVGLFKLILLSVSATAYTLLVLYDFFALVAFEQIMGLVRSKRYQKFYGSDPFNPILNPLVLSNPVGFGINEPQVQKHPIIVYVMPKIDQKLPKWWQMESLDQITYDENRILDDADKYFQKQELLANVLLHNAINLGYTHRKKL